MNQNEDCRINVVELEKTRFMKNEVEKSKKGNEI